ncbi:MAG: alkaline phosphatase D family protein, partial [Candidatus Poribacteria bacterium]|nr:alkaline phosphatase D family protein [Candidatus Poribacteria bacterium]
MKQFCRLLIGIIIVLSLVGHEVLSAKVYQANGIKIGEVTSSTAIIWTRLTKFSERNVDGVPFPTVPWQKVATDDGKETYLYQKPQIPQGCMFDQMQDVVLGTVGEIRIAYWQKKRPQDKVFSSWIEVNPNHDFTHQFQLTGLGAGTRYQLESQCRSDSILGQTIFGNFTTAPEPSVSDLVTFTVVTGQGFHRRDDPDNGHRIYPVMQGLNPDFFVHTGDIVYYDKLAPVALTTDLARLKWNRIYALPFQRDFHNHVASYFIKDDHDVWQNDCWPTKQNKRMGDFTFKQGQQIFLEQVPMGMQTYRTMRWGKDLQIWLVEGRDFRSPNSISDGPDKTIWGNQK